MKKVQIDIRTLPNANAKNQLENALNKIDGVKEAAVSGSTVKVSYQEPASADQITHCVRGAGNKLR